MNDFISFYRRGVKGTYKKFKTISYPLRLNYLTGNIVLDAQRGQDSFLVSFYTIKSGAIKKIGERQKLNSKRKELAFEEHKLLGKTYKVLVHFRKRAFRASLSGLSNTSKFQIFG